MISAVETLSPTRVKLTVEVPSVELKPYLDEAFKEIAAQIAVPGFRPGKVPTRLIEQRIGKAAVMQEAVNHALPELYGQAIEANELRPMGQPEVDITQMPLEDAEQLVFTAELDVRPKLDLPDFATLTVEVDAVDDAAIDEAAQELLTALRQRFGTLSGVERAAQDGDFVNIDLLGVIDGVEIDNVKGVSYEIGSGSMLQGMDEALTGMTDGEAKEFKSPLAGGDREGEEADITVTLNSVKVRELPELDDDFAQLASEFDTLDELQTDLRKQAEVAKSFGQGVAARDKLLELLLEQIDIPVPEGLIDAEVHEHLEGEERLDDDEHRAEVEEEARFGIRSRILLDTLAEERDVEITQQELIEFMVTSAQQYGIDPSEFARMLDQQQGVHALAAEVARRKALAQVLEEVQVKDSAGQAVDLKRVVQDDGDDPNAALDDAHAAMEVDEDAIEAVESEEAVVIADTADSAPAAGDAEDGGVAVENVDASDQADAPAAQPKPAKKAAAKTAPEAHTKAEASESDAAEAKADKPVEKAAPKTAAAPKSASADD